MSSFSYVALITPKSKISVAMSICEGTVLIGILLSNLMSGPVIDATNLSTLAYISAGIAILPLIIVSIFMTDATSISTVQYTWRDVIGVGHLLDAFRCIFKKRDKHSRLLLNLAFAAYTLVFIAVNGSMSDNFLYFVKERGMSLTEYSIFYSILSACKGLGGPAILWLINRFINPHKNNILIGACASIAIGFIILSIESIPYNAWIACIFFCTQTIFFGEIRSFQTSLCDKDELGKLFAYDALIQMTIGTVSTVTFKMLYSATVAVWAGMYLLLCGVFCFIDMIVVTLIDRIQIWDNVT